MMLLPCLSYDNQKELDLKISEYINNVLIEIVIFVKESHEEDKKHTGELITYVLEDISPSVMLRDNPKKCEDTLEELYELLCSSVPRQSISQKYNFFLFHCIKFYVDLMKELDISLNERIPEPLRSEILQAYGEEMIEVIENVDYYLDICFYDLDFLPEFLGCVVGLYLSDLPVFEQVMTVNELDECIELMDADLKEDYLEKRKSEYQKNDLPEGQFLESCFSRDLEKALIMIQKNKNYTGAQENVLNDAVRDHLSMKYEVYDQTRQGLSENGKDSGEIDLLVCNHSLPVAIIEALKISSVNKKYLREHIDKVLVNYDPNGVKNTFILIYATVNNFGNFSEVLIKYLEDYDYPYNVIEKIKVLPRKFSESFQAMTILERSNEQIYLHFFVVNMK